jgi:hypothetical protein
MITYPMCLTLVESHLIACLKTSRIHVSFSFLSKSSRKSMDEVDGRIEISKSSAVAHTRMRLIYGRILVLKSHIRVVCTETEVGRPKSSVADSASWTSNLNANPKVTV